MSSYEKDSDCDIQSLPKADNENEVFRKISSPSSVILRRHIAANRAQDENGLEEPELRRIDLEEEGNEGNNENLGPLRAFQDSEVRVSSRNRNSSDVEYVDDDGGSSVCSENIYGSGDFMSLPRDATSKWSTWERNSKIRRRERESLLESLEKQRRESVESRLKELRIPNKRHSVSSSLSTTSEMPIIAKLKPLKNATLPKQMRRTSYQSVILTPFFAKSSGLPVNRPLLLGLGSEMRERRGSLVIPNADTPTGSDTETFPLRSAESLSCIDNFVPSSRNVAAAKLMKALSPPETKTRKSFGDAVKSKETSPLSERRHTSILDHWSDASLERSFSSDSPAHDLKEVHYPKQDSSYNRSKQIRDHDFIKSPGDASETDGESLCESEVLTRKVSSSKTDSPMVSIKVCAPSDAVLRVKPRTSSVEETITTTSPEEQSGDISANDELPNKLHNGTYLMKREFFSDRNSDTSSTDNDDKHYERKDLATQNVQTPTSIETCREDKTTPKSPAFGLQTSYASQEALLLSSHQPERETERRVNAGFDLDRTWISSVRYGDSSANQNNVPVSPAVSKKYFSDIQIQVKEVDPVFPASFGQSGTNVACNGESRYDLLKESDQDPTDDDLEKVTPNWSSYPGPLPDGFRSCDLNDLSITSKPAEEANITSDVPERSVSKLEINLQPPSVEERDQAFRKEASRTDFRPESGFTDRRKRINIQNVTGDVFGTPPPRSVERKEMFVRQENSASTTGPRTLTLPRNYRSRPWNQFESQTRGPGTPQQQLSYSPKQELAADTIGTCSVPESLSVEMTPSKANVTRITFYSKKDEQMKKFRDGERTQLSFEAIGGISKSPGGDSWQASVVKREDRWKDSRTSVGSSGSPEKTPSVERIWETLEQPRTRLTKRSTRLGSDSEVVGSKMEKPEYHLQESRHVTSNGDTGETKKDALMRSISLQDPVAEGHVGESLLNIEVLKGGLGLGFCIEGGKDGPYGDRPITVKRLFRGSSDPKFSRGAEDSLRAGDEILSANGRDMTLLSRFVAWNFLKTLPEGTIKLVVRRRTQRPDSSQLH